jgi:hypothetical protein
MLRRRKISRKLLLLRIWASDPAKEMRRYLNGSRSKKTPMAQAVGVFYWHFSIYCLDALSSLAATITSAAIFCGQGI